jgi:hypothetical protein
VHPAASDHPLREQPNPKCPKSFSLAPKAASKAVSTPDLAPGRQLQ